MSSSFSVGAFLFRVVHRFTMASMWIDFVRSVRTDAAYMLAPRVN